MATAATAKASRPARPRKKSAGKGKGKGGGEGGDGKQRSSSSAGPSMAPAGGDAPSPDGGEEGRTSSTSSSSSSQPLAALGNLVLRRFERLANLVDDVLDLDGETSLAPSLCSAMKPLAGGCREARKCADDDGGHGVLHDSGATDETLLNASGDTFFPSPPREQGGVRNGASVAAGPPRWSSPGAASESNSLAASASPPGAPHESGESRGKSAFETGDRPHGNFASWLASQEFDASAIVWNGDDADPRNLSDELDALALSPFPEEGDEEDDDEDDGFRTLDGDIVDFGAGKGDGEGAAGDAPTRASGGSSGDGYVSIADARQRDGWTSPKVLPASVSDAIKGLACAAGGNWKCWDEGAGGDPGGRSRASSERGGSRHRRSASQGGRPPLGQRSSDARSASATDQRRPESILKKRSSFGVASSASSQASSEERREKRRDAPRPKKGDLVKDFATSFDPAPQGIRPAQSRDGASVATSAATPLFGERIRSVKSDGPQDHSMAYSASPGRSSAIFDPFGVAGELPNLPPEPELPPEVWQPVFSPEVPPSPLPPEAWGERSSDRDQSAEVEDEARPLMRGKVAGSDSGTDGEEGDDGGAEKKSRWSKGGRRRRRMRLTMK
ncbi:hypothetical protein ACHAWF_017021 [Thalassiosira exigua]